MTIDHLPFGTHNVAARVTWRPFGFFSGAAVFVFLAGYLASRDRGWRWAWQRAGQLYLAHAALVTALALLIANDPELQTTALGAALPYFFQHPWRAWAGSLLLLHLPSDYLCILPLYVTMFLALPLGHWLLRRKRGIGLLAASIALWAAAQCGYGIPPSDPASLYVGYFDLLAWQLPFALGLWIGRYRPSVSTSGWARLLAGMAAAGLFLLRHAKLLGASAPPWEAPDRLFGPLVLLNFGVWLYLWNQLSGRWVSRWTESSPYQALVRLGSHSLPVFVAHQVLGFAVMLVPGSDQLTALEQIGTIALTLVVLKQVANASQWRDEVREPCTVSLARASTVM